MNLAAVDGFDPADLTPDDRFALYGLLVFAHDNSRATPLENLRAGQLSVDFEHDLDDVIIRPGPE